MPAALGTFLRAFVSIVSLFPLEEPMEIAVVFGGLIGRIYGKVNAVVCWVEEGSVGKMLAELF